MTQLALRQQLKRKIDALPEDRLQSATDFVNFLSGPVPPSEQPSKRERFRKMIAEAEQSIADEGLVPLAQLKHKR